MCGPKKIINTLLGGYFKKVILTYIDVNFFFHLEKTKKCHLFCSPIVKLGVTPTYFSKTLVYKDVNKYLKII